jgi:hypothetical protein
MPKPKRKAKHAYRIVLGSSHASASDAAKMAETKTNGMKGEAIGIAADTITTLVEGTTKQLQWDVYVLIRT